MHNFFMCHEKRFNQPSVTFIIREITQQVDSLKAIGGEGGGGSDKNTVLAAEGRMTHHLQELRY